MRKLQISKEDKLSNIIALLLVLAFFGALLGGWVSNIVALVQDPMGFGELAVRIIGIPFVPLGIIMGYI